MEHGFFHPDRGYWQTISDPSDELLMSFPDGTVEIPVKPSAMHNWNGIEWVPPTNAEIIAALAGQVRYNRNYILETTVDPFISNPLRWNGLSPEQQQLWIDYRQALLNIPQQPGFPTNVIWPILPALEKK